MDQFYRLLNNATMAQVSWGHDLRPEDVDYDAASCSPAYVAGGKYRFCAIPKTYLQAVELCKSLQMNLVWYSTRAEMLAVSKYAGPLFDSWWIGLSNLSTSTPGDLGVSEFLWGKTGLPPRETAWQPNEPNNWNGNEHCVESSGNGIRPAWNDNNCDFQLPFVCKAD